MKAFNSVHEFALHIASLPSYNARGIEIITKITVHNSTTYAQFQKGNHLQLQDSNGMCVESEDGSFSFDLLVILDSFIIVCVSTPVYVYIITIIIIITARVYFY